MKEPHRAKRITHSGAWQAGSGPRAEASSPDHLHHLVQQGGHELHSAEGIPGDGRFYEPVYRSDLFYATPANCPQLRLERERPVDYATFHCPVSERAAYHEAVWVPQFVLLGDEEDVRDVARAVAKVAGQLEVLAKADPKLAGVKGLSRAERPLLERKRHS